MPDETPPAEPDATPCATCAGKAKSKPKEEDMSDTVTVSKAEYDRLRTDYEQTLDALGEALTEIDDFKAKLSEAGTKLTEAKAGSNRVAELEAKLRQATHAKAFAKLADELGIPEDLRDDVFKVSGYEAKGDEPDEKAMREHFAKYVESRPSLVSKGKAKEEPTRYAKGEGASRGSVDDGKSDKKQVTRAQLMDADWTEANAKLLSDVNAYEIVDAA